MRTFLFFIALLFLFTGCAANHKDVAKDISFTSISKERKNCWLENNAPTLLSVMENAMTKPLEPDLVRDNYIQTFGCAYEEVDIEKNAIQAVYRAVLQSLKNRNVTARDDLQALLRSRPPRPDNLVREYTIYVNLPEGVENNRTVASYQVKILQLEVVHTVESPVAIWTRVATRFMHREDHYRALPISEEKSAFVKILKKAENILTLVERRRFEEVRKLLPASENKFMTLRNGLEDLVFGDQLQLVDASNPHRTRVAIFLGKGILFGVLAQNRPVVFKFGEERLFGLRMNLRKVMRSAPEFEEFGYKAPETILQCLFLKFKRKSSLKVR